MSGKEPSPIMIRHLRVRRGRPQTVWGAEHAPGLRAAILTKRYLRIRTACRIPSIRHALTHLVEPA